jgi:hypothetical protein
VELTEDIHGKLDKANESLKFHLKTQRETRHGEHTCNSALGRLRQEDGEFKASLGYLVRPTLRKTK